MLNTPKFWRQGEPNNANQDEDCAVFKSFSSNQENIQSWNDQPCLLQIYWVKNSS
ncbi:hypothetical protein DPEC_G00373650 [Dallia pectoralis]|nr:hypothetical protein DPEC_G00373650 [Dallia pectoralis]